MVLQIPDLEQQIKLLNHIIDFGVVRIKWKNGGFPHLIPLLQKIENKTKDMDGVMLQKEMSLIFKIISMKIPIVKGCD